MSLPPTQTQIDQALALPPQQTIKDRLLAMLGVVLKKSKLNKAFLPVIKNMAVSFIEDMDEGDLRVGINELRSKYIPWLLGEAPNEDTST